MIRVQMNTCDDFTRRQLRFMLEARQLSGLPVVDPEGLIRELIEELDGDYRDDPPWQEIQSWAMGTGGARPCYGTAARLDCRIDIAYRVMVGAMVLRYHPDWLWAKPGAALGSSEFPAYDQTGKRVV